MLPFYDRLPRRSRTEGRVPLDQSGGPDFWTALVVLRRVLRGIGGLAWFGGSVYLIVLLVQGDAAAKVMAAVFAVIWMLVAVRLASRLVRALRPPL